MFARTLLNLGVRGYRVRRVMVNPKKFKFVIGQSRLRHCKYVQWHKSPNSFLPKGMSGYEKIGTVVNSKSSKTVIVSCDNLKYIRNFRRTFIRSKRFMAHDPSNQLLEGDIVHMVSCPKVYSKNKRYIVDYVIKPNLEARARLAIGLPPVPPPEKLYAHLSKKRHKKLIGTRAEIKRLRIRNRLQVELPAQERLGIMKTEDVVDPAKLIQVKNAQIWPSIPDERLRRHRWFAHAKLPGGGFDKTKPKIDLLKKIPDDGWLNNREIIDEWAVNPAGGHPREVSNLEKDARKLLDMQWDEPKKSK
eukprot:TRINITY_DN51934_c0_g1_i1.p1 TRINITY_DN51934_c0_g1~~TRINITY_DN51934_c0_g1_i1.p1  ORF type:complete len:303 (-),score=13.12 TRINITY_DN51934_c0_g1_i1:219-1127(-)